MGELEPWMDEQYIRQLWFNLNEKVMVKVIRDKVTGYVAGYAFVDFGSATHAQRALNAFSGSLIPNTHKQFKLNWASGGGLIDRREDRQPEYSIFVGDLSPECTELSLLGAFQANYRSCKSAKIMTDPRTGLTRGYGFVRFTDQSDQQRALIEMQGFIIGSRPIRVSVATPKNRMHTSTTSSTTAANVSSPPTRSPPAAAQAVSAAQVTAAASLFADPSNTTVFVGGLSAPIREDELRQYFSPFGEIMQVKIPPGKGCGFVQYAMRHSAELAIQQMNGYQIGNSRIRLSWGRSQNDNTISSNTINTNHNHNHPTTTTTTTFAPPPPPPSLSLQQHQHQQQQQPSAMPHPPHTASNNAAAAAMVAALSR
ncbi:hypothetical protein BDB00DRAFT_765354 [Zychaea mexicana]|uniref:uncharacterized protein n=1 Tax=Zychaea mexicana TaxID=64656 RepID=UPI0022FF3D33|nr:uncharacterized protein BDB00DRAFT_765354 [Zychaea mexicana]KAI9492447.1 hypothetical protein BDB00DRAFT_765354 [Zychaea mexicana]